MIVDFAQYVLNMILALFLLRQVQSYLVGKDSDFGKALSYLLH